MNKSALDPSPTSAAPAAPTNLSVATPSTLPTLTWSALSGAAFYDLWLDDATSGQGQLIRMPVKGISVMGRNTQGVRLVNLAPAGEGELLPDAVAGVTRVVSEEGDDGVNGAEGGAVDDSGDGTTEA